jgi:hypothetical protein
MHEVMCTKRARAKCTRGCSEKHTSPTPESCKQVENDGDQASNYLYWSYAIRTYMFFLGSNQHIFQHSEGLRGYHLPKVFQGPEAYWQLCVEPCCTGILILGVAKCHHPIVQVFGWVFDTSAGNLLSMWDMMSGTTCTTI